MTDDPIRQLRLDAITLWDAHITRGEAVEISAGEATAQMQVEPSHDEEHVNFLVRYECAFDNRDGERMADVAITYLLVYGSPDPESLNDKDIQQFTKSVVMQVTPFQREFLATVTNRMGLPPFYLPILRMDQLDDIDDVNEV